MLDNIVNSLLSNAIEHHLHWRSQIGDIIDMYNTDRGEAGQLKHLCTRIKQDRAMLLRRRDEIDTMLREMDVIEAQCRSTLAQLETA